ncbi:MAG: SprB repeat-containing protein, partial [Bacteroidota bacterium]
MSHRPIILRLALFCLCFFGSQYLEAQSIRLRAEITQLRSNYRKGDHRGPDISWKWNGTVSVDGIVRALNADCYHKSNGSKNSQSFNRTEVLIDQTIALPSGNGSQGALDLCEDIVFALNLDNWEDDRGGSCTYNGNGNIFQNDDDDRWRTTYTYTMFSVDAGEWRSRDVNINGSRYGYTIRFRYDLVDPIVSLTSNAANVVCDNSSIRLTANRGSGFTSGRYRFERRVGNGNWFGIYQGSRSFVDVTSSDLVNSSFRVASVSTDGCLGDDDAYVQLNTSNITVAESYSGSVPVATQGACIGTSGGSLTYLGEDLGVGVNVRLSIQRLVGNSYQAFGSTVEVADTDTHVFDGLPSGTYRINVTVLTPGTGGVIGECTSSRSNISVPVLNQPIITNAIATSPGCGGSTGNVAVSVNRNGSGNVQYTLFEAGTQNIEDQTAGFSGLSNFTFFGVPPGDYEVLITSSNGCMAMSDVVTINPVPEPASGTITVLSQDPSFDIACTDGTVPVQVTAPTDQGNYRVQTFPGGQTVTFSSGASGFFNVAAGTHGFVFTRLNTGCTFFDQVTVTENPTRISVVVGNPVEPTACMGASGSLTATVSDGVGPYTFQIIPGPDPITQADPVYTFPGLMGGNHEVIVTDARGCVANRFEFLPSPPGLNVFGLTTSVTCTGGSDGTIELSGAGGTPPRQFKIVEVNDVFGDQVFFDNLAAGTYTAAVRDGDGCEEMREIVVREPGQLVLSELSTDRILCNGNETNLQFKVTGRFVCEFNGEGEPGADDYFTVSLDGGMTFTAPDQVVLVEPECSEEVILIMDVLAGDYDVIIQDFNSCPSNTLTISEAEFEEPEVLNFAIDEVTNISCFGANDGTVTVSYSGGTPLYTIGLVELGPTPNDLPTPIATAEALEGTGTYTFSGLAPSSGPSAGYGVYIIDNQFEEIPSFNGPDEGGTIASKSLPADNLPCRVELPGSWTLGETFERISITEPPALEITSIDESPEGVNCDGTGGELTVNVFGGTAPYLYSLTEGGFEAGNVLFPEEAEGTVYVQDANGCITSTDFSQTFAPNDLALTIDITQQPVGCRQGEITVTLTGGDGPYTVELTVNEADVLQREISNGEPVVFENVDPDFYGVIVVDVFNCFAFDFFEVAALPALSAMTTSKTDESCYESLDGNITMEVSGGVAPYTIVYNGVTSTGSTRTVTGIGADYHDFVIIDAAGCSFLYTDSLEVATLLDLEAVTTGTGPCLDSETGVLELTPVGGTPPYDIEWVDDPAFNVTLGAGQSTTRSNLASIEYTVRVTDASGCTRLVDSYVEGPDSITVEAIDIIQPDCSTAGSFDLNIEGGLAPYQISINGAPPVATTSFTDLVEDTYQVTVTDANACTFLSTLEVVIAATGSISATADAQGVSCNGESDGIITVNAVGAAAGAMYSLNSGVLQTSNQFTGLLPGTYSVEVISGGCSASVADIVVPEPEGLAVIPSLDVDQCTGEAAISLAATGGTAGYMFTIDGNAFDPAGTFTGQPGVSYSLGVTDANG